MSRLALRFVTANVTGQIAKITRQIRSCHGVTGKKPPEGGRARCPQRAVVLLPEECPYCADRNSTCRRHPQLFAPIRAYSRYEISNCSNHQLLITTSTYCGVLRPISSNFDLQAATTTSACPSLLDNLRKVSGSLQKPILKIPEAYGRFLFGCSNSRRSPPNSTDL